MTPGEPLHVLELGLFKLMIEGFYVNLGYKPGSKSYPRFSNFLMCGLERLVRHWATKVTVSYHVAIFPMESQVAPSWRVTK